MEMLNVLSKSITGEFEGKVFLKKAMVMSHVSQSSSKGLQMIFQSV